MTLKNIYLDWNATAPIDPVAIDAMGDAARVWANPASVHESGRRARQLLEDARESLAKYLSCPAQSLIFTSGASESLGLALTKVPCASRLVSAVEHDAVHAQAPDAQIIPVDAAGRIDLVALEHLLADSPAPTLVAVMHANNETGVIQPIADIAALVRHARGLLLVDAAQTAGKLDLPEADFIAVSAHKLGGPPGVGALIIARDETFAASDIGGGQERGRRRGTQNLIGAAGFAAAMTARQSRAWLDEARVLRDGMEARLRAAGAQVIGDGAPRLPHVSAIAMPGVRASTQMMAFDLAHIHVSSGAACSSGKTGPSHVLAAMGVAPDVAQTVIRVSLGWTTTPDEIDAFVAAWCDLAARKAVS